AGSASPNLLNLHGFPPKVLVKIEVPRLGYFYWLVAMRPAADKVNCALTYTADLILTVPVRVKGGNNLIKDLIPNGLLQP
ncbi:hypothetical protein NXH56_09065, partial [Bifidobacterium thermophilum]|nr:hypothetical protein [Bifidobacterium thermophilum]